MAIRVAGEVLKDNPGSIKPEEDWRLDVVDETGLIYFQLSFQVMESPAMMGSLRSKYDRP